MVRNLFLKKFIRGKKQINSIIHLVLVMINIMSLSILKPGLNCDTASCGAVCGSLVKAVNWFFCLLIILEIFYIPIKCVFSSLWDPYVKTTSTTVYNICWLTLSAN